MPPKESGKINPNTIDGTIVPRYTGGMARENRNHETRSNGMKATRHAAIESGVQNAVDTVVLDKAMGRDEAYARLEDFASDGLSCYGLDDSLTPAELAYAQSCFPI